MKFCSSSGLVRVNTPCPALEYGTLITAWPPQVLTRNGISGFGTLTWVSGVFIASPVPVSSALNSSYALHVSMRWESLGGGGLPMSHHFIPPSSETRYDFVHDKGLCANGDARPGRIRDISETGTDRVPRFICRSNIHDPYTN